MTYNNIVQLITPRFPHLIEKIQTVIETSEAAYTLTPESDSFLWEHTLYVAAMTMTLAQKERQDPLLPVVAALFHDSGKFMGGTYHEDEIPEEQTGAEIAEKLLQAVGFPPPDIDRVVEGLLGLYNDQKDKNRISKTVHDADFLVKFGYMGFANFFEKSVLRGRTMRHSILKSLSKELTYAASLERNMFTASGKEMARSKAVITRTLFEKYIEELKAAGIGAYEIQEMDFNCCEGPEDLIPLMLVLPTCCDACGAEMTVELGRDRGIKCEKLMVDIGCSRCKEKAGYDFSFCLPELVQKGA